MTPIDSTNFDTFIPEFNSIPEDWEQARQFLTEQLKKTSQAINAREIGWFLDDEMITGQRFIPGTATPPQYRTIFRKVIDFGFLPNGVNPRGIPHGIVVDDSFTLLHIYGAAMQYTPLIVGIPVPSASANGAIVEVAINDTEIVITTNQDFTSFTTCFITIEYIQET